jgi:ATP-binding cassette subfamily F protein 3
MLLVGLSKVRKEFGGNPIFHDINLEIVEGERIGLVGENGSGKSTLFKLLIGQETPTAGTIARKRNLTIGYLTQETDPATLEQTIFSAVATPSPELVTLPTRMQKLEAQMCDPAIVDDPDAMERVLAEYSAAQERYEALGGYTLEHRAAAVLTGLGFAPHEHQILVGSLSGGEKKLVNLARILLQMPDLLLLDEPDNHLDLRAKEWLEQYIRDYPGTVLLISHDRRLLDRTVSQIYQLEDNELMIFTGNYSAYVLERDNRLQKQQETYNLQQREIKRLKQSMYRLKEWTKLNDGFASKARYMERRVEQLKQDSIDRPTLERERIHINLEGERSGKKVLELQGLSQAVAGRRLFEPFDLTVLYGERVAIIGANGSGKSTLLKAMMDLIPATTGTVKIGASVVPGYYSQEQETLPFASTPLEFVRRLKKLSEPQAIAFLSRFLFSIDDLRTPIGRLSGGEKSRLQIARLMLTEANFLILDEPTNNLDIASTEVLETALLDFAGTILLVSHDRYFLDTIATRIVEIGPDGRVRVYPGDYSSYLEMCG